MASAASLEGDPGGRTVVVHGVTPAHTMRWLAAGWDDFMRAPLPGLLHGVLLALFGLLLFGLARDRFWLLAGAFSGFLLMAPILATGLYAISRALERGAPVGVGTAWRAWTSGNLRLVLFGVLLAVAGTGWVLTSPSLITVFASAPVRTPLEFIRIVALDPGWLFEGWMALGGLLAAPVFASSVIAIPLLLERRIGVLGAVLTSWRAVLRNPVTMALWAALLVLFTLFGMGTLMFGFVVVLPWLGHASWHAYRDLVDASALPHND